MSNEFKNTNIQVEDIQAKMSATGNMKYVLTASDKKKYFFYQKNKGQDCDVFQTFNAMGVKKGSVIAIGYTEEEKSFQNKEGKTVNYTDRFIGSMREGQGIPEAPIAGKNNNTYHKDTEQTTQPRNYDKEAYEKCCSIWAAADLHTHEHGAVLGNLTDGRYWDLFQAIRKDGEKRFATGWAKAQAVFQEEKPFITPSDEPLPQDTGESFDTSGIPF